MIQEKLDLDDFKKIFTNINNIIKENVKYLSELDSHIGDGDHGITISRGFENAVKKINEVSPNTISGLLKIAGNALIFSMGGASGPIFGTIFLEMSKASDNKKLISLMELYDMFSAALEGTTKLGGAKPGDKTMVDSLYPAVGSLKESVSSNLSLKETLHNMMTAAENGVLSTKDMIASKGRSKYSGERSIGYQDPGATTLFLIIKAIYNSVL